MKRNWKEVAYIVLAMMMSILFVISSALPVWAEEIDEDAQVLGATSYKVGDIIKFGHYEQDGKTSNGKEEIEWEVLKVESDRVLVVSKYALDCKKYNEICTDVTWETCTLRKWLNKEFKNTAFTTDEQNRIPTVTVLNDNNPYHGTTGGNNTQDKIFCLSLNEVRNLIGYNFTYDDTKDGKSQKLIVEPTQYAINNGAEVYTITSDDYYNVAWGLKKYGYTSDVIGRRGSWWWLRSPGRDRCSACDVRSKGFAGACLYFTDVDDVEYAVRPALYIKTVVNPQSINLNKTSSTIYFGNSLTLTATVLPANATNKTVAWTSSKPAVATVSGGVVKATGKQAGTTTITAKTVNGLAATCKITVLADNVSGNVFADIKKSSWQYSPAYYVYKKDYMTGTGKLAGRILFSPNTNMTRAEFVTALYSLDGKPSTTFNKRFSDVPSGQWYSVPVTWAANRGITSGFTDGTFKPNNVASRAQIVAMLFKYAQFKGYNVKNKETLSGFSDVSKVDSWALDAFKWAVAKGIIAGKDGKLDPKARATRAEFAAMLRSFSENYIDLKLNMEDEYIEDPIELPEDVLNPGEEDVIVEEDEDVIPEEEEDIIPDEDEDKKDEDVNPDEPGDKKDEDISPDSPENPETPDSPEAPEEPEPEKEEENPVPDNPIPSDGVSPDEE